MLVLFAWFVVIFAFVLGFIYIQFGEGDRSVQILGVIIAFAMAYFPILYIFGGAF